MRWSTCGITIVVTFLSLKEKGLGIIGKVLSGEGKKQKQKQQQKYCEGTDGEINSFMQCFLQNFEVLSDVVCKLFKEEDQKL